jgi:ABC-type branched-subunit amino acid transport system substrate-binding protein
VNSVISKLIMLTSKVWQIKAVEITPCYKRRSMLVHTCQLAIAAPAAASVLAWTPTFASAQPLRNKPTQNSITIAQIVDMSASQQDVSKDFLVGSRAAWQDLNMRGGLRGRNINHVAIETDGTEESLRNAWEQVHKDTSITLLSGCSADSLASQLNTLSKNTKITIANVAPWQQNSSLELGPHTFGIFSRREEQIAHALRSLTTVGVSEIAVVFASTAERKQNLIDIQRIAVQQKLRLQEIPLNRDLFNTGQSVNSTSAAVILFVGGTPELAQFTQGLGKQSRQRYIVALADVNLNTLQQMGGGRSASVIVTQAVPLTSAVLPVVREYRQVLAKLYDEAPTSLSLAGFIAARYTMEVLQTLSQPINRASALEVFERRVATNVGGFMVAYEAHRRTTAYVTQSMLSSDGRVIG